MKPKDRARVKRLESLQPLSGSGGGPLVLPLGPNANFNTSFFVDPSNSTGVASDTNPGTALLPLLHYREVTNRWQSTSPLISTSVTLKFLSDQPDATDPVVLTPAITTGGSCAIVGNLIQVATGIVGGLVAKNRAGSGAYPLGLLQANLGPSQAKGLFVVNTTRGNSCAWIDSVTGGLSVLTQPANPNIPAFGVFIVENDAWANGDSFILYRPTNVYVNEFTPVTSTFGVDPLEVCFARLGHVRCPDPSGTPGTTVMALGHAVRVTESRIDTYVEYPDSFTGGDGNIQNSILLGSGELTGLGVQAGALGDTASVLIFSGGILDADAIVHGTCLVLPAGQSIQGVTDFALAYFSGGSVDIRGTCARVVDDAFGVGAMYGSYSIALRALSKLNYNAPALSRFLGVPTFEAPTAMAIDTTVNPAQLHSNRVLSAANLDNPAIFPNGVALANDGSGSIITAGF